MTTVLATERFWVEKSSCQNAERQYYELLGKEDLSLSEVVREDHFDNKQPHQQIKLKKSKKSKGKKNDNASKLTETSTNSDSEERFMLFGCQAKAPFEPIKNSKSNNEKSKKRNKATKKNSEISGTASNSQCTLVSEIAKAREHIKNSLEKMDGITTLTASPASGDLLERIVSLEKDNADLKTLVEGLRNLCHESVKRITALENQLWKEGTPKISAAPVDKSKEDDDDGVDLFASDSEEENEEATRIREERLAAYAAKKSKKPALIAKSSLVLDVKPWDDETDLKVMETNIRNISADGLLWGASKFVPVAFSIQKLSISCVVEDEKISIDWLTEEIEKFEDYVQSVDVAAFNKI